ncbi:MAG: hypothetical protein AAGI11_19905 [Pseudomonadota bacterium]
MLALRAFLAVFVTTLLIYTVTVANSHGWSFMPTFIGELRAMTWPGQFIFDFVGYLGLTALWVAWRHAFSPAGLLLALCAFFGAALFFFTYLLVVSFMVKGDARALLLGPSRATA